MPVRKIPMNHRSVTGRVARVDGSASTTFESTLERDLFILLDFDLNVAQFEEQPVRIEFLDSLGSLRTYTPDVLITYRSDIIPGKWMRPLLVEVKYRKDLWSDWQILRPKFKAAVRYAHAKGWQFKILTEQEIRTPCLDNAKFLRRFRSTETPFEISAQIREILYELRETTPECLLTALRTSRDAQAEILPFLWHLVAVREIGVDLTLPLTMQSQIWSWMPREGWSSGSLKGPILGHPRLSHHLPASELSRGLR